MIPQVSIIVPVYNKEKYLPPCIDSILSQSFTCFELLLIDDGSIDSSCNICDSYVAKDVRVRVFHKKNGGVSSARNFGLNHARGEWIWFIDADDYLENNYLSIIMSYACQLPDILFFGNRTFMNTGISVSHIPDSFICHGAITIQKAICYLKNNNQHYEYFGYTWNKIFKRSIIKQFKIRFIESLSIREDELFTMEYCKHISTLKVVDEALYDYRIVTNGLTARTNSSSEYIVLAEQIMANMMFFTDRNLIDIERQRAFDFAFRGYKVSDSFRECMNNIPHLLHLYRKLGKGHRIHLRCKDRFLLNLGNKYLIYFFIKL